jgi:hypothetical protein
MLKINSVGSSLSYCNRIVNVYRAISNLQVGIIPAITELHF